MVSAYYTGCDECTWVTENAAYHCQCQRDCENEYGEFVNCYLECSNEPFPQDQYFCEQNCVENYSQTMMQYENCKSACDAILIDEVIPRQIFGYQYTLIAAWDDVPNDPRSNQQQRVIFTSPIIEESVVNIQDWNVPPPWPEIYNLNNTCYGIELTIVYVDGIIPDPNSTLACIFREWTCNLLG